MTERTDSIPLPYDQARCAPASCTMTARCARKLAALPPPPHLTTLANEKVWMSGGSALCVGFVDAATLRKQVMQPVARKVHPPLGSV